MVDFWNTMPQRENENDSDPQQSGVDNYSSAMINQAIMPQPRQNPQINHEINVDEFEQEEQSGFDLDTKEEKTVSQALLRLEQGRLYQMLIEHDFFEGIDANNEAINEVREELKTFIIERLEILLGIKEEPSKEPAKVEVELPFNELEILALKRVASKVTGGESEKIQVKREVKGTIKPLNPNKNQRKQTLKSKETALPKQNKQIVRKTVERPVEQPKERQQLTKPIHMMTPEELAEHNRTIPKSKKGVPIRSLPQPTSNQQEMYFQSQMINNSPVITRLVELAEKNKK